jgi:thiol peroxidase
MKHLTTLFVLSVLSLLFVGCVNVRVNTPSAEDWKEWLPKFEKMPKQRKGVVTKNGEPLTLLGPAKKVDDEAPGFKAVDKDYNKVDLKEFKGKVIIIAAVPSVDTKVCGLETRKFNEDASQLSDVVLITISHDLPFALSRFCAAEGINNIHVWSDHVYMEFGVKYGVLIKESILLARSVFVIDKKGKISYIQIVPDLSSEPDYQAALDAARAALQQE